MTILWALLVGIDEYPVEEFKLDGSRADVEHMYQYLVQDRNVPPDNIRVLVDDEATRDTIIEEFERHLIHNPAITPGDPILFHYSGHGTSELGDSDWIGTRLQPQPYIEHIVPVDCVRIDPDDPDDPTPPGIPDRTISALLRQLARAKGNNITVTFDCCHSAHATRHARAMNATPKKEKKYKNRGIKRHHVGRLRKDTDKRILTMVDTAEVLPLSSDAVAQLQLGVKRGAASSGGDDTHVLLAACARDQQAVGSVEGGIFTNHVLKTLRAAGGVLSNRELIDRVKEDLEFFYRDCERELLPEERPDRQDPTCVGRNRDRPVFQSTHVARGSFDVREGPDSTQCKILAGATGGVTVGTIFQLRLNDRLLGTAVATSIGPGSCLARLPEDVRVRPGMQARLVHLAQPLKVFPVNTQPTSPETISIYDQLSSRLSRQGQRPDVATTYEIVDSAEKADIVLAVNSQGVEVQRRTGPVAWLDTENPIVSRDHVVSVFPNALKYIALFNFYLSTSSPDHPLSSNVGIHFHELEPPNSMAGDDDLIEAGKEIAFSDDGEVQVVHEDDALYALVLKNHTQYPLYPYVLFFDPATYTVQIFYEPPSHEAPLQPGQQLQLGRSVECMAAIFFTLDENNGKDTGFLKIIFATEELSLKFMEQDPVLGLNEAGKPNLVAKRGAESNKNAEPLKGAWDTVLRRVTVLPPPEGA